MSSDTRDTPTALPPEVAEAIAWLKLGNTPRQQSVAIVIAELERLAATVEGYQALQTKQAEQGMKTALSIRRLAIDKERLAAENAALKAELATLRSQLSRIDYAFGSPNEMRCSPYDADFDGERVVRQVEAMAATVPEPPTEDAGS